MNGQVSGKDANDLLAALHQRITETEAEMEQLRAKLADIRTAAGAPKAPADGTPILGGEQNVFSNFTSIESPFDYTLEIYNTSSSNTDAYALTANSSNAGGGILSTADNNGTGVYAFSRTGDGLFAQSIQGPGAVVTTQQGPIALYGWSAASADPTPYGIVGFAENGVGILAVGGTAPIRLQVATTAGAPTSGNHVEGELFLDSNVTLFLCKQSGTPGIWKELG
jgi:hypothetical protein